MNTKLIQSSTCLIGAAPVGLVMWITRYQMGGHICSNNATWRIFNFLIHERDLAVIHFDFSAEIYNEALIMIKDILISTVQLIHFGMSASKRLAADITNNDVQRMI